MSERKNNELNRRRAIRLRETGYDGIEPTPQELRELEEAECDHQWIPDIILNDIELEAEDDLTLDRLYRAEVTITVKCTICGYTVTGADSVLMEEKEGD